MDSGDDAGVLAGTDVEEHEETRADTSADTSADTPAEPGPDDDPDAEHAARGAPIWLATMTALVIALIAGVVVALNYNGQAGAVDARTSGQAAAQAVARTAVSDMITTDYRHPDAYIARLRPLAAGQFLSTFVNAGQGLSKILQQGKVQTSGQVTQVAVQSFSGDTATILALANETVKNTQTPQGSMREYRIVLSMIKSGSQWMVSNVEFVQ